MSRLPRPVTILAVLAIVTASVFFARPLMEDMTEFEKPCLAGAVCNTGNPCAKGQVICDAVGTPHCIASQVIDNPRCLLWGREPCVSDIVCSTGDPCARGHTFCDASGTSHCLVTEYSEECAESPPVECVDDEACDFGDPCFTGRTRCDAKGVAHCIAVGVDDDADCSYEPAAACPRPEACNPGGDSCIPGWTLCDAAGQVTCIAVGPRTPDCRR
jgi:hypothetical protein